MLKLHVYQRIFLDLVFSLNSSQRNINRLITEKMSRVSEAGGRASKEKVVQLQLMYTPLFSRTEQEKNPIGVTNERVISSSENNRIGVTKEGRKFIEKNYRRGYTEAICKTKFVNSLSPNS